LHDKIQEANPIILYRSSYRLIYGCSSVC